MSLKTLSISTVVLFLISIFVFLDENKRGTDLLEGSDFVKGLDITKITKIGLGFPDDQNITLSKDGDRFVVENHKSYPASTEKINDLIYKIASIQVKEKTLSDAGEDDLKKYELSPEKRLYYVELYDTKGDKTLSFSVGKSDKGKGNYLLKDGMKEIYLSTEDISLNSSYKDFIKTVLLDVDQGQIEKLSLNLDKTPLEIVKKDKEFVIETGAGKDFSKDKAEEYAKSFTSVEFDDYFSVTEPAVMSLNFDKDVKIELQNKLIYQVSFAKSEEDHYVKLKAMFDKPQSEFVVKQDDGKEDLKKIDEVIKAQKTAQRINLERGSWIYKIDKSVYEKLAKDTKFFM